MKNNDIFRILGYSGLNLKKHSNNSFLYINSDLKLKLQKTI